MMMMTPLNPTRPVVLEAVPAQEPQAPPQPQALQPQEPQAPQPQVQGLQAHPPRRGCCRVPLHQEVHPAAARAAHRLARYLLVRTALGDGSVCAACHKTALRWPTRTRP